MVNLLEAFVRLGHAIVVFPGGAGTACGGVAESYAPEITARIRQMLEGGQARSRSDMLAALRERLDSNRG